VTKEKETLREAQKERRNTRWLGCRGSSRAMVT
jgi:hypothetical protein